MTTTTIPTLTPILTAVDVAAELAIAEGVPEPREGDSPAVRALCAAAALVARGWCQGEWALSPRGDEVDPDSTGAVAWCVLGALVRVTGELRTYWPATTGLLKKAIGTPLISDWNDAPGRTRADVIAAFARAVALGRARQQQKQEARQ